MYAVAMPNREQLIGENVQRLRSALPMTQAELANRMKQVGYKWSQATVWSVEKGERPLRLSEAEELGKILDVATSDGFLTLPLEKYYESLLKTEEDAWERVEEGFARWARAQILTARAFDGIESEQGMDVLRRVTRSSDPEVGLREGILRAPGHPEISATISVGRFDGVVLKAITDAASGAEIRHLTDWDDL